MKSFKIFLITNTISPYRIPTFNYLANNLEVLFVFLCPMLKDYKMKVLWDKIRFKYQVLPGKEIVVNGDFTLHISSGFIRTLWKFSPDVIVSLGYAYFETFIGLLYAKLYRKKFVLWSGSTLQSSTSRNAFTILIKKILFRNCDAFLAYGSAAAEYLIFHGAARDKIIVGCNTVDVTQYSTVWGATSEEARNKFKTENGLAKHNILYSGQLLARKNLLVLLKAFKMLARSDWGLVVVGDGPMKDEHMEYYRANGIANVFFKGHQDLEQLTKYYIASDIFVLPSVREVWGLVINEAMASGLPVLCSRNAGAARDLVRDGVNGYVFDPKDAKTLRDKLILLVDDAGKRENMGKESMRIISEFTPQKSAADLLKAVDLAMAE